MQRNLKDAMNLDDYKQYSIIKRVTVYAFEI